MKPFFTSTHIWLWTFLAGVIQARSQTTLTFDEFHLPAYGVTFPVTNGYGNLQWSNFWVSNPKNSFQGPSGSGFLNAVVSTNNLISNGNGNSAQISSDTLFDLNSAYLTADWMDGLQVEAQGFVGSILKYNNIYTINTASPTKIDFNYRGVSKVIFAASGGTKNIDFSGFGPVFAIDDMATTIGAPLNLEITSLDGGQIRLITENIPDTTSNCVIQTTTNYLIWTPMVTNTAPMKQTTNMFQATNVRMFYRAMLY